ncbi:MAG: c-type cytochrome [Syntrophothermus sp.]
MKKNKIGRTIGIVLLVLVVLCGVAFAYIMLALPNIPAPEMKVANDTAKVAHGRYLAMHVAVCVDCHSTRDWNHFSGPVLVGTEGRGGERFDQTMGFPGVFYAKNITPYNLEKWSDGEIYRAITSGVTKNRGIIFPVMPYLNYGKLATEDIQDIIAYVRTMTPVNFDVPSSKADFPMNIILHMIPEKPQPAQRPSPTDSVNYGKYLVTAGACFDCHTPFENGKYIESMSFAGGREFPFPSGIVRSANITPDKNTGIGTYTSSTFLSRFKAYDPSVNQLAETGKKDFNSIMPWSMYAGMKESDLRSIFAYLSTIRPIQNQVVKFTPVQ